MKSFFLACAVALSLLMSACTNEDNVLEKGISRITMAALDFNYLGDSRTSIDFGPHGGVFTWAANDTVGIFPDEGTQVAFPMVSGAGTKEVAFTGGGWALKPSSTYAAYYPMQGKFYLNKKSIPVNFEGQIQNGNASTAHLGEYDFMAAKAITPKEGNVNFGFKHLGCIIQLKLTLPKGLSVPDVSLSASGTPFITHGIVDLTTDVPSIQAASTSSSISIKLEEVSSYLVDKTVTVYFMMAPTDLSGKDIEVAAAGYKATLTGKHFEAGYAYALAAVFQEPDPSLDWVDLGLPSGVKWASHNVGARNPEDYGDYFAWGEIAPKPYYDPSNSLTFDKSWNDITGDVRYDAATANWGEPARLPTKSDIWELEDHTTHEWTTLNGVEGIRVVSKKNNNSIFLPAAGFRDGTSTRFGRSSGDYWSGVSYESDIRTSYVLTFNDTGNFGLDNYFRNNGRSVRPVCD